jgi:hypothetical protein
MLMARFLPIKNCDVQLLIDNCPPFYAIFKKECVKNNGKNAKSVEFGFSREKQ